MGILNWLGLRRQTQWQALTLLDHLIRSPLTYLTIQFYYLVLLLRGHPFRPPRDKEAIKVVCISDTHDAIVSVPPGDILIHAGDLTSKGTAADIQKQIDWLRDQPHPIKIVIAGNHDSWFDSRSRSVEDKKTRTKVNLEGVDYLEGNLVSKKVRGRTIHIFGAPDIPQCGPSHFAFQYTTANQPWFSKVPPQTDILVTHTPAKHHRDLTVGCPHLLRELWRVRPRLHVFGHVHAEFGIESLFFDDLQAAYELLMSRPRRGPILDFVPNQQWLDILQLVGYGLHSVLWKWLMGGPGSNRGSVMVNAAQMDENTGIVKSRAIVVEI